MTCHTMHAIDWRRAVRESTLTRSAKLVAFVLAEYWSPSRPVVYPNVTHLMSDCSSGRNTILRALEELTKANFISPGRRGISNNYSLVVPSNRSHSGTETVHSGQGGKSLGSHLGVFSFHYGT